MHVPQDSTRSVERPVKAWLTRRRLAAYSVVTLTGQAPVATPTPMGSMKDKK